MLFAPSSKKFPSKFLLLVIKFEDIFFFNSYNFTKKTVVLFILFFQKYLLQLLSYSLLFHILNFFDKKVYIFS